MVDPTYTPRKLIVHKPMEKVAWTHAAVKSLITMYGENDFLYNPKSPHYKNRVKRLAKYNEMAMQLSYEVPGICANDIKKKINSLRTQYVSEKLKMNKKMQEGGQTVCTTTLHWYPLMTFLDPVLTSVALQSSNVTPTEIECEPEVEMEEQEQESDPLDQDFETVDVLDYQQPKMKKRRLNTEAEADGSVDTEVMKSVKDACSLITDTRKEDQEFDTIEMLEFQPPKMRKRKLNATSDTNSNVVTEVMKSMKDVCSLIANSRKEDNFEVFGKYVATELREISLLGHDSILRELKSQIQRSIIDAWTEIDSKSDKHHSAKRPSMSESSSSSQ